MIAITHLFSFCGSLRRLTHTINQWPHINIPIQFNKILHQVHFEVSITNFKNYPIKLSHNITSLTLESSVLCKSNPSLPNK